LNDGFESHSLRQLLYNQYVGVIFWSIRNPLSALVFIFRMSDMQFRAVRKRADKSESEKATVSESVARNAKRVGLKSLSYFGGQIPGCC
jgi:hypothetical protein